MKPAATSQQLRSQLSTLRNARQSLQRKQQISDNIVKLSNTLGNIKPLMSKQSQYIKNFLNSNQSNDHAAKQSQSRRYISRICQIFVAQIQQIVRSAEGYFRIDLRNSWVKVKNQLQKQLQVQRQQTDQSNILQLLFKILNLKEKFYNEFIKSLIYRKCLLWKDLNIVDNGYIHSQKKDISKKIQQYILENGFAPTKPFLPQFVFQKKGRWGLNQFEQNQSPLGEILTIFNHQFEEICQVIRNYSGLNQEQLQNQDIQRNKSQLKSLRFSIEQSHNKYQILQKKYRQLLSKDEKFDVIELKEKLKIAQEALDAKETQLKHLKYTYRDFTKQMTTHKQKIKQLENDLNRITSIEMKKLKEVEIVQNTLQEQFSRIFKNMNNFGNMFEFESQGKKQLAKEIISQKDTIYKMADMIGKQKRNSSQLKIEIQRLNDIILELGNQGLRITYNNQNDA